jgi:hypothetical protein
VNVHCQRFFLRDAVEESTNSQFVGILEIDVDLETFISNHALKVPSETCEVSRYIGQINIGARGLGSPSLSELDCRMFVLSCRVFLPQPKETLKNEQMRMIAVLKLPAGDPRNAVEETKI